MRVLFLVTDDWFFWSHRKSLARAVRDAGGEVVVATSDGEQRAAIEAEGFAFEPVAFRRTLKGQLGNVALVRKLAAVYTRRRPDVVHHVSFLPILYGTLAARRAGVPSVVNAVTGLGRVFIGDDRTVLRRLVERAYRRVLLPRPGGPRTYTLFQNPDDEELFVTHSLVRRDQSSIVPGSGVDIERFRVTPEAPGTPVVLFCSRMLETKGVEDLIEACRLLRERGVDHRLLLAGTPHEANPGSISVKQLAAWHAAGDAVWLGRREDIPELLAAAHVIALPSYYREGVPLALIEGAASGRALVSTNTPGCREIVRDGQNGLVVEPRSPQALADALASLLADPERRRRMGARGREIVEAHFAADVVNREILGLYRRLAGLPAEDVASHEPPSLLPRVQPAPARRAVPR